jgi:hypothetical protein
MLEILATGAIPAATIDAGISMPFDTNKISWYLVAGGWIAMSGLESSPWHVLHFLTLAVVVGTGLCAWVFLRGLLERTLAAAAGTLLLLWLPWLSWKLFSFAGETFGVMLMFAAFTFTQQALSSPDWRKHLLVGLTLGLLGTAHAVPAAIAAFWYVAVAAGLMLTERGLPLRRVGQALASAGLAIVLVLGIWEFAGGGLLSRQVAVAQPESLKPYRGYDPTRAFAVLATGRPLQGRVPPYRSPEEVTFYVTPSALLQSLVGRAALAHPLWPNGLWGAAILVGVLLGLVAIAGRRQRYVAPAVLVAFGLLYALGLLFSYRYNTWLPALHPIRREFPYAHLLTAISVAAALDVGVCALQRGVPRLGRWLLAIELALAGALLVPAVPRGFPTSPWTGEQRMTVDGLQALRWLRTETAEDARILTDGSSDGVVWVLANRVSIIEGRAPYFRQSYLAHSLRTLEGALTFYAGAAPVSWLRDQRVDYVIEGSHELGTRPFRRRPFRPPPGLELAARFGGIRIYRVAAAGP